MKIRAALCAGAAAAAVSACGGSPSPSPGPSTTVAPSATASATPTAGAGTATPTCDTSWGTGAKQAQSSRTAPLVGIRGGQHDCYDRLVFDIRAPGAGGYSVEYVDEVVEEGSGRPVPLRGSARLAVVVQAPAYGDDGKPTYVPANRRELLDVTGWRTFRQVAWAGSFEGQTTVGLGVRAVLPFRVLVEDGGTHIVVDVAHEA
jgi:hypothetical protein